MLYIDAKSNPPFASLHGFYKLLKQKHTDINETGKFVLLVTFE